MSLSSVLPGLSRAWLMLQHAAGHLGTAAFQGRRSLQDMARI